MKEVFMNKALIGVCLIMMAFVYIKSEPVTNLDENINNEEMVYQNVTK